MMMSDGGKGSGRRKSEVPQAVVDNNWETIFGKKEVTPRVQEEKEFGSCGCGRSPSGKCCGWHGLSEEEYQAALAEFNRQQDDSRAK